MRQPPFSFRHQRTNPSKRCRAHLSPSCFRSFPGSVVFRPLYLYQSKECARSYTVVRNKAVTEQTSRPERSRSQALPHLEGCGLLKTGENRASRKVYLSRTFCVEEPFARN